MKALDEGISIINSRQNYKSVLDTSILSDIKDNLLLYFAKVHSSSGIHPIIGWIYFFIFNLQLCGPAFLINIPELWSENSVISKLLYLFAFFWLGPTSDNNSLRILLSLFLTFIYLISFLFLIIRSYFFSKKRNQTYLESILVLFIYKYLLPCCLPIMTAGFSN